MRLPLLAKIQKFVDHTVEQSNCGGGDDALRLNHFIWLALISIPLSIVFIIRNISLNHHHNAVVLAIFMLFMILGLFAIPGLNVSILFII